MFANFTEVQRLDDDPEVASHAAIVLEDGRNSWYSGYHHGERFAARVRYAFADRSDYRGVPTDRLRIGNFCQFASGTSFLLGGNHGHDLTAVSPYGFVNFFDKAPDVWAPVGDTVVGHEAWLGYESLILPGVHIGVGAVIGARSVVSKDIPPYAVVVGSNRIVRYRFDPMLRKLLWRIAWWTWPDRKVSDALPLLQGHDVLALARYAGVRPEDVADDPDPITIGRQLP